jgi:WD40 repeat protein
MDQGSISAKALRVGKQLLMSVAFALFASLAFGQAANAPPRLLLDQALERRLARSETHGYQVTLKAGEFMQVRVEQKGVDVALSIHSADGTTLAAMDSPNGTKGFETLSFIAESAGNYVVQIKGLEPESDSQTGVYRITLTAKRTSTYRDKERIEIEKELVSLFQNKPGTMAELMSQQEKIKIWISRLQTLNRMDDIYRRSAAEAKAKAEQEAKKKAADERRKARQKDNTNAPQLIIPTGHSTSIQSISFSTDGKLLASVTGDGAGSDKIVKLWDVATGREIKTLAGHTGHVHCVVFSPDGKTLASGSEDDTVKLWDVATGQEINSLKLHSQGVRSVTFSTDGRILAAGGYEQITMWDMTTGKEFRTIKGDSIGSVFSVAFSSDGKQLASGGYEKNIKLWNVATGQEVETLTGHTKYINSVAFSPDGKTLASGSADTTVKLWDAATGQEVRTLKSDSHTVYEIAFSPDGKVLASVGLGGSEVKLWDIATGQEVKTLEGRVSSPKSVAFSADGKLLASGGHESISLWDIGTGQELKVLEGTTSGVESTTFSPDGKTLASGNWDRTVKLWDVATGQKLRTFKEQDFVRLIAFSEDGKTLASVSGQNIKLWDVMTGQEMRSFTTGHTDVIRAVAFSADGKMLASGSDDKTIKLWDVTTGQELQTLKGHTHVVWSVAFSPDGKTLASGSWDKTIKLWDIATGQEPQTLKGHTSFVTSVAFSPDGKTLASGSLDIIKLWDVTAGKISKTLFGPGSKVKSVRFLVDGKLLASLDEAKAVKFWDVASEEEVNFDKLPQWRGKLLDNVITTPNGKVVRADIEGNRIVLRDTAIEDDVATFIALDKTDWAVIDADGRWDASDGAQQLMYYTLSTPEGYESIEFSQLKERYYEPGLLQKVLGYNKEPLRKVAAFNSVKLPPKVAWTTPATGSTKMNIMLANRGGGIGKVQVLVNGKEAIADARPAGFNPKTQQSTLPVDLKASAYIAGKENNIEVIAWNYDEASKKGYVSSPRGVREVWTPEGKSETAMPELYAIIGGVSDYAGDQLDLRYAAKDAEEFAHALELGATNLLGKERVHIKLLATGSKDPQAIAPTKENFRKAFEEFRKAKPTDILVIYLAGHGVTLQQGSDLYLYLTQEARTTDAAVLADEKLRESMSISSEELVKWLTEIKALKQVMVLDTCAAGAAAPSLIAKRDLPSDQIRAIDRLKDRTGFFVLMGSAADAVSYEASRYGQGLLTYTLLQAMKGARLREGVYADVNQLFDYAADTVPQMARNIGGIQRPVIISPLTGSSFDIGRYTEKEKVEIRLSQVKPLILRPRLQNKELDYDNLKLEPQLRQALREASFVAARGERESALVFVDADEKTDAVTPSGSYVVEGDKVKVTVRLIRNDKPVATVTAEGNKNDKEGLIRQIIQSITQSSSVEAEPRKTN